MRKTFILTVVLLGFMSAGFVILIWSSPCIQYRYMNQASSENRKYILARNQRLEAIRTSLTSFQRQFGRAPQSWSEWSGQDPSLMSLISPVENGAGQFRVFYSNFGSSARVMLLGEPGYMHPCHAQNTLPRSVYGVFSDATLDMITEPTWPPLPNDTRFIQPTS